MYKSSNHSDIGAWLDVLEGWNTWVPMEANQQWRLTKPDRREIGNFLQPSRCRKAKCEGRRLPVVSSSFRPESLWPYLPIQQEDSSSNKEEEAPHKFHICHTSPFDVPSEEELWNRSSLDPSPTLARAIRSLFWVTWPSCMTPYFPDYNISRAHAQHNLALVLAKWVEHSTIKVDPNLPSQKFHLQPKCFPLLGTSANRDSFNAPRLLLCKTRLYLSCGGHYNRGRRAHRICHIHLPP